MKTILRLLMFFTITLSIFAQSDGTIISTKKVQFPPYENIKDIRFYYSKPDYENAVNDQNLQIEKIYYYSDGLKVVAYMGRPVNVENNKFPVVIFNRGSFIRNDIAFVHAALFKKFVDNGFIMIAPAIRQSEGGEGIDEMGGKDVDDVMNILPLISSLGYADTSNIFMYGESRGGMMTLQVLRNGFPLNAAATVGAFTDLKMLVKSSPNMKAVAEKIWPDFKENKEKIYKPRSAVLWADKINAPLLTMQGNKDQQINPEQSLILAGKLQTLGKSYQLIIIDGGNHTLSGKNTNKRDYEIISWFKEHLK